MSLSNIVELCYAISILSRGNCRAYETLLFPSILDFILIGFFLYLGTYKKKKYRKLKKKKISIFRILIRGSG